MNFSFKLEDCDFCGGDVHLSDNDTGRCSRCGCSSSISGGPIPAHEHDELEPARGFYSAQVR